jgi:hypothetical protein
MDNGCEFSTLRQFCEEKDIRVYRSPAYHPQTNGECENRNRTIKSRLKLLSGFVNWDKHLPYVIHQMNSAKHSVTKLTPFEIEFGFEGENPTDSYRRLPRKQEVNLEQIRNKILDNHMKRRSENEAIKTFEIGQQVLLKNVDPRNKLEKFVGPYEIKTISNQGLSFSLENPRTGHTVTRHISHLKQYTERQTRQQEPEMDMLIETSPVQRRKLRSYSVIVSNPIPISNSTVPEPTTEQAEETIETSDDDNTTADETLFQDALDQTISQEEEINLSDSVATIVQEQTEETNDTVDESVESGEAQIDVRMETHSSDTDSITSSRNVAPVTQRICDLPGKALDQLITELNIEIKSKNWLDVGISKKQRKLDKIYAWIETNKPDWRKDDDGYYLIEHDAIVLGSRCYLNQLSLADLKVLIRHLDLDVEFGSRAKKDVVSEIKSKTLQKFPAFKCTKSGNLIIDPSLLANLQN